MKPPSPLWFHVNVSEVERGPRSAPSCGRVDVIRRHHFPTKEEAEAFQRHMDEMRARGWPVMVSPVYPNPFAVDYAP